MKRICVAVVSSTSNVRSVRSGASGRGATDGNASDGLVYSGFQLVGSEQFAVRPSQLETVKLPQRREAPLVGVRDRSGRAAR